MIERAVILSESEVITIQELKLDNESTKKDSKLSNSTLNLSELEKEAIIMAIDESQGNITKAAKKLGITRTALYRRMDKHEL